MQGYILESLHGGFCCGMTHIYTLPTKPSYVCPAREKLKGDAEAEQKRANYYQGLLVNDTRPEETALERMKAIVSRIEKGEYDKYPWDHPHYPNGDRCLRRGRPQGIIEVVVNTSQIGDWRKSLESLGFKEVNNNVNSNTGRTVFVFHRNSGSVGLPEVKTA